MSDYLTRTPIISLKEFTVHRINDLGWESNLFMGPSRFFQVLFTQFNRTQTSESDLVERWHVQ